MYITTLVTIGPINGTFQTEYLCVSRASWQEASALSITLQKSPLSMYQMSCKPIKLHFHAMLKLLNFFFRKDFYTN